MPSENATSKSSNIEPLGQPPRDRPRFRIQEAILILRQGKSHPQWREAAWHLMENAGKDTQLLLEAQRDLMQAAFEEGKSNLSNTVKLIGGAVLLVLVGMSIWQVFLTIQQVCS